MFCSGAALCSWDNVSATLPTVADPQSTRGLDASTALDYAKSLHLLTDIIGADHVRLALPSTSSLNWRSLRPEMRLPRPFGGQREADRLRDGECRQVVVVFLVVHDLAERQPKTWLVSSPRVELGHFLPADAGVLDVAVHLKESVSLVGDRLEEIAAPGIGPAEDEAHLPGLEQARILAGWFSALSRTD